MSPPRTSVLALAVIAAATTACATASPAARRDHLPPPASETRAGIRATGAGPVLGSTARPVQARRVPRDAAVTRALATASGLVGRREIVVAGVSYGDGCAALVRAAFAEAGVPLPEGADAVRLHALARERAATRRARPAAGDLVFLADRPGGPAEHVGIVQTAAPDGTAVVLHRTERGVQRLRVNGASPWKTRGDGGRALNDVLVVGEGRVTAGRLLVAYATLL